MKYKDTLALYDELIASGTPDAQARAQAGQLGAATDVLGRAIENMTERFASIDMKFASIDVKLAAIDKDLIWMRVIGSTMIVTFFANMFYK